MRSRHGSLEEPPAPLSASSSSLSLPSVESTESFLSSVVVQSRRQHTLTGFLRQDRNFRKQRQILFELQTRKLTVPFHSALPQRKASKEFIELRKGLAPPLFPRLPFSLSDLFSCFHSHR